MISVQILEDDDLVEGEDWCRPLIQYSLGDTVSYKSMYSGTPENNLKWVKAKCVFGNKWLGKPAKDLKRMTPYEFVRGDVPSASKLDMRGYACLANDESTAKQKVLI